MLTQKYRPSKFSEVIGQKSAVSVLKAMAGKPKQSPRVLFLQGEFGTGKTTLARIFGAALACESFAQTGDVCGVCRSCLNFKTTSDRYMEFDSSLTGSVQAIQDIQPVLDQSTLYPRVVVFDEIHLASKKAQSALLKTIEEGPDKTFFMFATTDPEQVIRTIISRSLPIEFSRVDHSLIVGRLKEICAAEGKEVDDEALERIALKSDGHVRDALMTLDGYLLSRDRSLISLPVEPIQEFLFYRAEGNFDTAALVIEEKILKHPLSAIQRSMNYVALQMVKAHALREFDGPYGTLAKKYGQGVYQMFKLISTEWVQQAFKDEHLCYSFFLTVLHAGKRNNGEA